jgi:hypothetical protein
VEYGLFYFEYFEPPQSEAFLTGVETQPLDSQDFSLFGKPTRYSYRSYCANPHFVTYDTQSLIDKQFFCDSPLWTTVRVLQILSTIAGGVILFVLIDFVLIWKGKSVITKYLELDLSRCAFKIVETIDRIARPWKPKFKAENEFEQKLKEVKSLRKVFQRSLMLLLMLHVALQAALLIILVYIRFSNTVRIHGGGLVQDNKDRLFFYTGFYTTLAGGAIEAVVWVFVVLTLRYVFYSIEEYQV